MECKRGLVLSGKTFAKILLVCLVLVLFAIPANAETFDTTADITVTGGTLSGFLGLGTSVLGDFNGDGYDDLAVSAYGERKVYIYYKGPSHTDNTVDVTLSAPRAGTYYAYEGILVGDFNGNGYDDLFVDHQDAEAGGETDSGYGYVYYGGASMDSTEDVNFHPITTTNGYFGYVGAAGDVNNDGYTDLAVSDYVGTVHLFYGASGGIDATADKTFSVVSGQDIKMTIGDVNDDGFGDLILGEWKFDTNNGRVRVFYGATGTNMDTTADVTISGSSSANFGIGVSASGDVDADGAVDLLVGEYAYNGNRGRVFLYRGGTSWDTTADATYAGEGSANDYFGSHVQIIKDVNDDGYDDVVAGEQGYSAGGNTGRVYLFYGGSSFDTTVDVTFTGENAGDKFYAITKITGDENTDGCGDLIISAHLFNGVYTDTGKVYFYRSACGCPGGKYLSGVYCIDAGAGYYSPDDDNSRYQCPAGRYGSTTTLSTSACTGACDAGRYGNATGQTASTCVGQCSAGYYCPAGSIQATNSTCGGNNYYCPASSGSATTVSSGYYSRKVWLNNRSYNISMHRSL
ncbi:MAG: VCBS repeat-containing protein [Candidatus Aenigmarchaeota archaeon]|nr:VCBS repeat-containing protein [Candidatus Aenigmarchaeota archaeon]